MSKYRKVVLTQFGIPSFNTLEYRSNAHLAPGYLVGYAKSLCPETEFIITPRIYTDILPESQFIEYIEQINPDLLSFTLYLWNIEKSLRVVGSIMKRLPNVTVIFGGPEVNPDNNFLLKSEFFNEGLVGEGEVSFANYIMGKPKNKIAGYLTKECFNDFSTLRTDYKIETNPYLSNIIETTPDTTMFFETVRGCPFSCNFCYYNKVYDKVVSVGHKYLNEIFDYARKNDFRELFVLDPTFNIQPNFGSLLQKLCKLNSDNFFEISTELRSDFLNDEQILKLAELNLVEAEIGLQTTNSYALKVMGRDNRTAQTIERTKKMIESGIKCKVDLIVGLPGDTLENFKKSVDTVAAAGIGEYVQVFRLSILSGTEFSLKKDELGLVTEPEPPYYLKYTPTFSEADIREALDYAEEAFEVSLYPIAPYLLSKDFNNIDSSCFVKFESNIKPIHKIVINDPLFNHKVLLSDDIILCESLVVHFIVSESSAQHSSIIDTLIFFGEYYVHNNFQFILEFENDVSTDLINDVALNLPQSVSSYLDRDATANLGVNLNLSCRLAIIVPIEFRSEEQYDLLQNNFDIFIKINHFDSLLIDDIDDNENIFICGTEQKQIFNYLTERDLLDDFTLFDSYKFEMMKDEDQCRIYYPNQLSF